MSYLFTAVLILRNIGDTLYPNQTGAKLDEDQQDGYIIVEKTSIDDVVLGAPFGDKSQPAESMDHRVEAGCVWDKNNWSCAYDSVFMSFWYIYRNSSPGWRSRWKQQAPEWNNFFGEAFDSLFEMAQYGRSSQAALSRKFSSFRETFRDNLSRIDPIRFKRNGPVLASVCRIFSRVFTGSGPCEPHLEHTRGNHFSLSKYG